MPPDVIQVAGGFAGAEPADFAARFAPALTDPARATPDLVAGPRGKAAGRRYDVYRNNVTVSLIEALAAIYPAVQRLTGAAFFRAMARFHVRQTPPTSPLLFEYGRDFPAFIAAYEHARDIPWLADVARIERAWLDAYHAADADPLDAGALARVPADRLAGLTFRAHPATRIVRSVYASGTIFAANRGDGHDGTIDAGMAEDVLITRPDANVALRQLPPGAAAFLGRLVDGHRLDEAAQAALDAAPGFDIGAAIAAMIEAGAFTALELEDLP
ncbi:DNA-binding domain-containing protein [Ancylobacter sp. TS-1]|uniref:HvfC/BufC N-terminal domain-containing protein n=1 Tax=Ancylobacter sp. TS-1 TaxID=1850374 RepID=UPI001265BF59|nr:DNA-binding domain-containing protein [Ancylobacter sp. TS-1]QFR33778.1 DUF2063 domain-containing protein [Ancylobacter sp. TS-1]